MTKIRTEKTEKAFRMGILAFESGMKCIPAHDKELMEIATIKGIPFVEVIADKKYDFILKENLAAITAWTQGWTMANTR